uniref:Immunoglobulin V-set domain-containing protein n=1 Tax=Sinocyclocheilus grahami TaxID=75366 RepID=A0A672JUM4_SINGR
STHTHTHTHTYIYIYRERERERERERLHYFRKDSNKGKRNNQLSSWVFQLNGVLDNVSQEDTYDCVVPGAFGGYNGWSFKCIHM